MPLSCGANVLQSNRASDIDLEVFEIHVRPLDSKQLAHPKSRKNDKEHGGFARLLHVLEQGFDLLDTRKLLTLEAGGRREGHFGDSSSGGSILCNPVSEQRTNLLETAFCGNGQRV